MLTITIPGDEFFDEDDEEFVTRGDVVLEMEHSLVSLSKWESKFEKPFLSSTDRTSEEVYAYLECMILTPDFPPGVLLKLTEENLTQIRNYIDAKMTATWFSETIQAQRNKEIITSELIYYWMLTLNIPMECENWHLNRLFTLIRVCNTKNTKPKKMSAAEVAARNRELNAKRKAQLGTRG